MCPSAFQAKGFRPERHPHTWMNSPTPSHIPPIKLGSLKLSFLRSFISFWGGSSISSSWNAHLIKVLHSGSLAESASQPAREMSGGISQPAKEMPGGISQATKTAESASQPRRCPAESASQPRRCPAESASQPRRCAAESASQPRRCPADREIGR